MDLPENVQAAVAGFEVNAPLNEHVQNIPVSFRYFGPGAQEEQAFGLFLRRRTAQVLIHAANLGTTRGCWALSLMTNSRWALQGPVGSDNFLRERLYVGLDGVLPLRDNSIILPQYQHEDYGTMYVKVKISIETFHAQPDFKCVVTAYRSFPNVGPSVVLDSFYLHPMRDHMDATGKDILVDPILTPGVHSENWGKLALATASAKHVLASVWHKICGDHAGNKVSWDPAWQWIIARAVQDAQFHNYRGLPVLPTYVLTGHSWKYLRVNVHRTALRRWPGQPFDFPPRIHSEDAGADLHKNLRKELKAEEVINSVEPDHQRAVIDLRLPDKLWIYIRFLSECEGEDDKALARVTLLRKTGGAIANRPRFADFYLFFGTYRPEGAARPQSSVNDNREELPEVKVEEQEGERMLGLSNYAGVKKEEEGTDSDAVKREDQTPPRYHYDLATHHQRHSITSRLRHLDLASNFDIDAPEAEMSRRQKTVYGNDTAEEFERRW